MTLPENLQGVVRCLRLKGFNSVQISKFLKKRYSFVVSPRGIRYRLSTKVPNRCASPRKLKVTDIHLQYINFAMNKNRNLTANELKMKLLDVFGLKLSIARVKHYRKKLGWTANQTGYCQMISGKNKLFRKKWVLRMLSDQEDFQDVIFTDESTVEMSASGKLTFYQSNASMDKHPGKAPKAKHAYKLHVWGGISYRGRTNICIFSGIMDSATYQLILRDNLLPFVRAKFPDGYLLYQDNDSKHKSKATTAWLEENHVQTITTPASSPDINPIENVWAAMKDHLKRKEKPRTKEALISGIKNYWKTLTPAVCGTFIDHIHKVLPEVVLNGGSATQY